MLLKLKRYRGLIMTKECEMWTSIFQLISNNIVEYFPPLLNWPAAVGRLRRLTHKTYYYTTSFKHGFKNLI